MRLPILLSAPVLAAWPGAGKNVTEPYSDGADPAVGSVVGFDVSRQTYPSRAARPDPATGNTVGAMSAGLAARHPC